jgi:hypothetical protein
VKVQSVVVVNVLLVILSMSAISCNILTFTTYPFRSVEGVRVNLALPVHTQKKELYRYLVVGTELSATVIVPIVTVPNLTANVPAVAHFTTTVILYVYAAVGVKAS